MKSKLITFIYLCLIFLLSSCAKRDVERNGILPDKNFHLFLLAGQSNMAGRGIISDEDKQTHPRILMLTKELKWISALDPIHYDKASAGLGLAKSFALELVRRDTNLTVGLIPSACGGSPISTWEPGGYHDQTESYPYDDAITRAQLAMEHGILKGVLWHQGESDCNPNNADKYYDKLKNLIDSFREDLEEESLPFIIGQLGKFPNKPWSESRILVDKAQQSIKTEVEYVSFVSSDSLTSNPDNIHFNSESLKIFGKRYADAYLIIKK